VPQLWAESLQRWAGWAELYLGETERGPAPTRNDIWLLFQTLVGIWPAQQPHAQDREALRQRVQDYMRKAVREAKQNTSWVCPEQAYEDALARYVDAVLRPGQPNPFVDELQRFTMRIAAWGFRNSLAQVALKFTVPGVPDVYQGCEQWNFSLVDPDNRRPVDFGQLARSLSQLQAQCPDGIAPPRLWRELHAQAADGRIKQLVTWRLLQLRQHWPLLFRDGGYQPLPVEGPAGDHAVAFARLLEGRAVVVVAARLTWTLCGGEEARWTPAVWAGTRLRASESAALRKWRTWRHWLTGTQLQLEEDEPLDLQAVFAGAGGLPFAVLLADSDETRT
jgi:(1->4)-alpha-D-glucan 1-alpha-D-glucosylmutase